MVETFRGGRPAEAHARFVEYGRMSPEGRVRADSWLGESGARCFQLLETADPALFEPWMAAWDDLVAFEVVPLIEKPV